MSLAEVFLRVGSAMVGWLLVYAHALLLAVVPRSDCSAELWRVSALFALLALVASLLLRAGLPWRGMLRWLALPAALLWAIGGPTVVALFGPVTLDGVGLCSALLGAPDALPAAGWERAWPPLQALAIVLAAARALGYWRPEPEPEA